MGLLHRLCEEEEWDKALKRINDIAELIVAMDSFGMWDSRVMDAEDILYTLSVLEDDIRDAKDHDFYMDLDECDDEDLDDEDDSCCDTCDVEDCPYDHRSVADDEQSEKSGDLAC